MAADKANTLLGPGEAPEDPEGSVSGDTVEGDRGGACAGASTHVELASCRTGHAAREAPTSESRPISARIMSRAESGASIPDQNMPARKRIRS